jgi:SAM-dependent methyltransferase
VTVDRASGTAARRECHEPWLRQGQTQFDYLLGYGLDPAMRVLEIGCGNLRAGRLLIDYLEPGNYYGIDISPDILLAAVDTVTRFGLETKLPRLTLVQDLEFDLLPPETFDVIHAHRVFSHSPIEVIEECLRHVGRIMAAGAFFDFTFSGRREPNIRFFASTFTTGRRP